MTQLKPLKLDNGAIIYIETNDAIIVNETTKTTSTQTSPPQPKNSSFATRESLGKADKNWDALRDSFTSSNQPESSKMQQTSTEFERVLPIDSAQPLKDTIRNYTEYIIDALKDVATAEIKTVKLEFGVELGGDIGIPYIAKGSAKSTLKVAVEVVFPTSPIHQSKTD